MQREACKFNDSRSVVMLWTVFFKNPRNKCVSIIEEIVTRGGR